MTSEHRERVSIVTGAARGIRFNLHYGTRAGGVRRRYLRSAAGRCGGGRRRFEVGALCDLAGSITGVPISIVGG